MCSSESLTLILCLGSVQFSRNWGDRRQNTFQIIPGSVVRRLISANPRLNFNLDFFIPLFKCLVGIVFRVLYRASNNHIIDKKIRLNFLRKLSDLKLDFTLTLGYLNLALNNPAPIVFALFGIVGWKER